MPPGSERSPGSVCKGGRRGPEQAVFVFPETVWLERRM